MKHENERKTPMSKLRNFVRRPPDFMESPPTRRDRVLNWLGITLGCLFIAGVLRALFEIWLHTRP
jgi:hypothetical protein